MSVRKNIRSTHLLGIIELKEIIYQLVEETKNIQMNILNNTSINSTTT